MVGNERSPPPISGVRLGGAAYRHHLPRQARTTFARTIVWRPRVLKD